MDKRLKENIPVPYLLGVWDFFGREFKVREGVFIPRPETEILVEKVLPLIPENAEGLEIGCGSGCISITLLLEKPSIRITAVDINPASLELSLENAKRYSVESRLTLLKGDMFEPVKGKKFDFIVSNPPYIPASKWKYLPPEVKYEGYTSLIAGKKGYEFHERLSRKVKDYLKKGGILALEIGHDQGAIVKRFLEERNFKVMIYKDYAGQDRVVLAWN